MITPFDFDKKDLEGGYYFSYKEGSRELCLEPCLNGFDVAVYNLQGELLQEKECTDLSEFSQVEALDKACKIANKMFYGESEDEREFDFDADEFSKELDDEIEKELELLPEGEEELS